MLTHQVNSRVSLAGVGCLTEPRGLKFRIEQRVLDTCPEPADIFDVVAGDKENAFLLESSVIREGFSRYSFIGDASGPFGEVIKYDLSSRIVSVTTAEGVISACVSSVFDFLDQRLRARGLVSRPDFPFDFDGGYVGYLCYELKAETSGSKAYTSEHPAAVFLFASRFIAIDHQAKKTYLVHLVEVDSLDSPNDEGTKTDVAHEWLNEVEALVLDCSRRAPPERLQSVPSIHMSVDEIEGWIERNARIRHSRQGYIEKIAEVMREIIDGETYEVCLTNSIEFPLNCEPFKLYQIMRQCSPAPHAGFFRAGDLYLLSASPERFISVDRYGHVEAKPIKGTRPRCSNPQDDIRQIDSLQSSEKERAENLMIVDLLRNDLGRVCQVASVSVPKLFAVESYSHVHQLVSTITGKLRADVSTIDCVRASFPGGSMTGAPKIRTMDIIDRLEEGPRGIYSGTLGWFGLSGACDLNIVIRSLSIANGMAQLGVGGALTALSDPNDEFVETLVKARSLIEAIESLRRSQS